MDESRPLGAFLQTILNTLVARDVHGTVLLSQNADDEIGPSHPEIRFRWPLRRSRSRAWRKPPDSHGNELERIQRALTTILAAGVGDDQFSEARVGLENLINRAESHRVLPTP